MGRIPGVHALGVGGEAGSNVGAVTGGLDAQLRVYVGVAERRGVLARHNAAQRRLHSLAVRREDFPRGRRVLRLRLVLQAQRRSVVAAGDLGEVLHRRRRAVLLRGHLAAAGADARRAQGAGRRGTDLVLVHESGAVHHEAVATGAAESSGSGGVVAASSSDANLERPLRANLDCHRRRFLIARYSASQLRSGEGNTRWCCCCCCCSCCCLRSFQDTDCLVAVDYCFRNLALALCELHSYTLGGVWAMRGGENSQRAPKVFFCFTRS